MTINTIESRFAIHNADSEDFLREQQPANSVDVIFTSPDPVRTYEQFIKTLLILGLQCRRVLKPTGSMWVHMEDAFNEQGSLMRWPAKFSTEMISEYDWILRAERIWHLPVGDQGWFNEGKYVDNNRLILDHSYIYHFTQARYGYYNTFEDFQDSKGRRPCQICSIFTEKHLPVEPGHRGTYFSMELVKQSLLMTCPNGGTVMDPFCGTGTTGGVALSMTDKNYTFVGIEKDAQKTALIIDRLTKECQTLTD